MVQLNQPVEALQVRPPRYGLLVAAPTIEDSAFRYGGPFSFLPERCGQGGRLTISCEGDTNEMTLGNKAGVVDGEAFVVFSGENCSTLGMGAIDFQGRAERQLQAIQSHEVAAELWTGSLGLVGRPLAHPLADTLSTGDPRTPEEALACIEQGIANYGKGRQGMVHVTPQMLVYLATNNSVYRDANLWLTPMGNIVVADSGYPGTGPNGEAATSTQWVYGTSMIGFRLGAVETIPGDLSAAVTRSTNDVEYWVYRPVAWQWDECIHVAAEVDVAPCLVGGAS